MNAPYYPLPWEARGDTVLHRLENGSVLLIAKCKTEQDAAFIVALANAARVLLDDDSFCPSCGHNRDRSSISTVILHNGSRQCQMCSATWIELDEAPLKLSDLDGDPLA